MTYLVNSNDFGVKEFEEYDEVLNFLRQCTAFWCADPSYEGEDFETLYNECLENRNFEGIAQVFEVDTYFLCSGRKIPCGLFTADRNATFKMKRIL